METDAQAVVRLLEEKRWHITFAESCTGGLAAARLVDVPDASGVFGGSFVTYAPEIKSRWLGVDPALIRGCGVVSEPVALAMAVGAAERAGAEVSVGVSGVAGPSGGTEETPVGTVCFGFAAGPGRETATVRFGDLGRNAVREKAVDYAFSALKRLLETPYSDSEMETEKTELHGSSGLL